MTSEPSASTPRPYQRKHHNAKSVLLCIFGLALIIGCLGYWRFIVSDRFLRDDVLSMQKQGKTLSVEGCVDAVVLWASRCRAMKSLCDATAPRMMDVCLAAGNRSAYCRKLGQSGNDTHFGFEECRARKVKRKTKKACASAYRAIANHCEYTGTKQKRAKRQ